LGTFGNALNSFSDVSLQCTH